MATLIPWTLALLASGLVAVVAWRRVDELVADRCLDGKPTRRSPFPEWRDVAGIVSAIGTLVLLAVVLTAVLGVPELPAAPTYAPAIPFETPRVFG